MEEIEQIPIAELHEDPANVRRHGDRNLSMIAASLKKFGQQKPIVISKENVVLAGNATFRSARELGWETIGCVRSKLEDAAAIAYAIADNRSSDTSTFDNDALLQQLDGLDYELVNCAGYDDDELRALREAMEMDLAEPDLGTGPDSIPESYQVIVECADESQQRQLYSRFSKEGLKVKVLQV